MQIPQEKRFHFHDGTSVGSIEELKKKLEKLPYEEFYEHVNEEKNDFANWIEHVLENKTLAAKLNEVSSIVETVELLNEELHTPPAHDEDYEDLQARIEEKLFADLRPNEEWTTDEDVDEQPASTNTNQESELTMDFPEPQVPVESEQVDVDSESLSQDLIDERPEVELPTREELESNQRQRESVISGEESHKPVTVMVQEQPPHPDHMKFVVKQFIYGLVLGLIAGLILGRLIPL